MDDLISRRMAINAIVNMTTKTIVYDETSCEMVIRKPDAIMVLRRLPSAQVELHKEERDE